MDDRTYDALSLARIGRARELLEEAENLLKEGKYKSANNRAFYSIEKSMKALLAKQHIDADSHNGCLRQFNVHFVKEGIGGFDADSYKKVADAQRIRNNSDYDDFYIADKEECTKQVETARYFYERSKTYMESKSNERDKDE